MEVVFGVVVFFGAVLFFVYAASFFMAVRHRKPGISWTSLAFNSLRLLDADNYTEAGQKYYRRGLLAMMGFFVCGFLAVVVGIVGEAL